MTNQLSPLSELIWTAIGGMTFVAAIVIGTLMCFQDVDMKNYTVFYKVNGKIEAIKVKAHSANVAARMVKAFYHGSIVSVE